MPYTKFRADGWPMCPRCGADELYSLEDPATIETIHGCYVCGSVRATIIRNLVGGPFDGDTVRFFVDQKEIVVPDRWRPFDTMHTYAVGVDGHGHYVPPRAHCGRTTEGSE